MALTRKMLKAMGIEEDKIEQIITEHVDITDALKKERDGYKAEADKVPDLESQLETLKQNAGDDSYKDKYEAEHKAFEDYKKGIEKDKENAKKADAYKALLKKAGVSEGSIEAVVKVTAMDDIELDDKGEIKNADKLEESIKTEWAGFILKEDKKGADVKTPPSDNGGAGGAKTLSRAAQVVAKHNELMYGVKGDNSK